NPSLAATAKMAAAWVVSFNVAWGGAAQQIFGMQDDERTMGEEARACHARDDFAVLAALPAGDVLAISNLGPMILANSTHRALAGPYHRNHEGNLAMIDAMVGPPPAARAIATRHDIVYLAVCPGDPETRA